MAYRSLSRLEIDINGSEAVKCSGEMVTWFDVDSLCNGPTQNNLAFLDNLAPFGDFIGHPSDGASRVAHDRSECAGCHDFPIFPEDDSSQAHIYCIRRQQLIA